MNRRMPSRNTAIFWAQRWRRREFPWNSNVFPGASSVGGRRSPEWTGGVGLRKILRAYLIIPPPLGGIGGFPLEFLAPLSFSGGLCVAWRVVFCTPALISGTRI